MTESISADQSRRRILWFGASALVLAVLLAAGGTIYVMRRNADPSHRAELLEQQGNYRAAQVELRSAIGASPRDPALHMRIAEVQMKLADPVAAEKEFRLARALGADRWVATARLADALLAQGLNEETLRQLPENSGAPTPAAAAKIYYMRSVAQFALGDTLGAAVTLAAAQRAAPNQIEVLLIAARVAAAKEDYAQTEAKVDEVLRRDPTQIDALLMKQQIVTARNDHAAALDFAQRAVASAPWSAMARIRDATELMYANQDAKAQADVDAVLDVQPRFIEAIYLNGVLLARRGRYDEASAELQRLDSVLGRFPQALYYKALIAANLGQTETAVAFARRYNVLVPADPDGIRLVARSDIAARASDHAIPILEKAAADGMNEAEIFDLLGSAYANVGNTPAALQAFERARALAPADPAVLTHLGLAQIQSGNVADASITLAQTVDITPVQPIAAEALVSAAIAEGDLAKAAAALARLRVQVGDTQSVGILTGMIEVRRKNLDGARSAFADALRRFPASLSAKIDYARSLVLLGRRFDGMALMTEVLEKDPANVAALNSYMPLLVQNRQLDRIVAVLTAAHAADPRNAGFTATLADALVLSGESARAVTLLKGVSADGPLPTLLLASLARAQAGAGMADDAKANFRDVLRLQPDDLVDRRSLIDLLLRGHDYPQARLELLDALKRAPGNFRFLSTLVEVDAQTRGIEAGLKLADELRADPAHLPYATLLRGDALMRARRYNAAIRAYLDEYAADPEVPPLLRAVAAYSAAGQDEEAAKLLRAWIAKQPNTPAVLVSLGKLDIKARRLPAARAQFEAAIALLPNQSEALNNLAWVYQATGDKRARAMAQRAYLADPGPEAADTLGWILVTEGDPKAGLPLLQQAASVLPNQPTVQYHLAAALRDDGQPDPALKLLQQITADPRPFDERDEAVKLLQTLTPK